MGAVKERGHLQPRRRRDRRPQAEVRQFDLSFRRDQDVLRPEIAVCDALRRRVLQRL